MTIDSNSGAPSFSSFFVGGFVAALHKAGTERSWR
jgi:hypothetical protein